MRNYCLKNIAVVDYTSDRVAGVRLLITLRETWGSDLSETWRDLDFIGVRRCSSRGESRNSNKNIVCWLPIMKVENIYIHIICNMVRTHYLYPYMQYDWYRIFICIYAIWHIYSIYIHICNMIYKIYMRTCNVTHTIFICVYATWRRPTYNIYMLTWNMTYIQDLYSYMQYDINTIFIYAIWHIYNIYMRICNMTYIQYVYAYLQYVAHTIFICIYVIWHTHIHTHSH